MQGWSIGLVKIPYLTLERECGVDAGRTNVVLSCTSTVEGTGSDEILAVSIGGEIPLLSERPPIP